MYLVKTPTFIQNLFPNLTWSIPQQDKVIYLTFDDGPIPAVTPWVLDTLEQYNAHGTFFCVGENVERNPRIFQEVIDRGHSVGNHTQHHKNGWATNNLTYLKDVEACATLVNSNLFRPPYGRIGAFQTQFLQKRYRLVMWDVLSGDFDQHLAPKQCADNVVLKAKAGSIVVFHDSLKAEKNLRYALPKVLEHFSNRGFRFEALSYTKLGAHAGNGLRKAAAV